MFKARGYTAPIVIDCIEGSIQFWSMTKGDNSSILFAPISDSKLGNALMDQIIVYALSKGFKHCILLLEGSITPKAKLVSDMASMTVEIFKQQEMLVNVLTHKLQPSFTLVGDEEAELFRTKYNEKLPKLLTTDIVCRWYKFPVGSIVQVKRANGFIAYRQVVKDG
jgi:DNA-directed RNA polymerase subunit H (RpoH/RPB5)